MKQEGVRRLICLSNVGAGDSAAFQPWYFTHLIQPLFLPWLQPIIDDKNRMEPFIINSGLDWTLVRCPNITDKPPKGSVKVSMDGKKLGFSIHNGDVAMFLVDQIENTTYNRNTLCISN